MSNTYPIHRIEEPQVGTLTRRRDAAQALRNDLAAYKQLLRMHGSNDERDGLLARIDGRFAMLLALEGMTR